MLGWSDQEPATTSKHPQHWQQQQQQQQQQQHHHQSNSSNSDTTLLDSLSSKLQSSRFQPSACASPGTVARTAGTMTAAIAPMSRQRSAPASPILTSSIALDDLTRKEDINLKFSQMLPIGDSRPGYSLTATSSSSSGGSAHGYQGGHAEASTSRPSSRSASWNHNNNDYSTVKSTSRSRSPIPSTSNPSNRVQSGNFGISRATTPLLHNSNSSSKENRNQMNMFNSHSSSSFLLGSSASSTGRDSYMQLPDAEHSMVDLNHHTTTRPGNNTTRRQVYPSSATTNKSQAFRVAHLLSPAYYRHRAREILNEIKSNLSIGVEGEWRDLDTGKLKIPQHLKAYVPLLIWVGVSIAFGIIVGVWHEQVFAGLDSLSTYLKSQGYLGDFLLYLCIFITTFPPLPLYSTLIFLSGYSFGLLHGFIISYTAALSGAVIVYLCSKIWLKNSMERMLNKSTGLKKVLRAIERRPRLLWLIRLSPYPYNVMNVLLASSSTLSFSCYFWCTALALPKLIIHCSVGTTIRSFAESAKTPSDEDMQGGAGDGDEELQRELDGQRMKATAGLVGIILCVGVFIYLLIVARRAVDELDDTDCLPSSDTRSRSSTLEEGHSGHQGTPEGRTSMAEYRPLSSGPPHIIRPLFTNHNESDGRDNLGGDDASAKRAMMMTHRHVFERQDSSMPLPVSSMHDLRPSSRDQSRDSKSSSDRSTRDKKSSDMDIRVEYVAGYDEGESEDVQLLGPSSQGVVDRLESIAHQRQTR